MEHHSLLERMNLPGNFGYVLLVLGLVLLLAPYFGGSDFGVLKIPEFSQTRRRRLQVVGPAALIAAVALHLPLVPSQTVMAEANESKDMAPRAAAAEASVDAAAGDPRQVLVNRGQGGCLYPARVLGTEDGTVTVQFSFGVKEATAPETIMLAGEPRLDLGGETFVKAPTREAWAPAAILDLRADHALVEVDPSAACAGDFPKLTGWYPSGNLISAARKGTK